MEATGSFETSDRVEFMEDSSLSAKMTTVIYNLSNLKRFFMAVIVELSYYCTKV